MFRIKVIIKLFFSILYNGISILRFKKVQFPLYIQKGLIVNNPSRISLGKNVTIGRYSRFSSYSKEEINIHNNVYICNFFSILAGGKITIGENTLIASFVAIISENHGMNPELGIPYGKQDLINSQVSIGKNCWIGEKTVILPGVRIGDWCIIGAASVVTNDIPSYSIAVGNPAKVVKRYDFSTSSWKKVLF